MCKERPFIFLCLRVQILSGKNFREKMIAGGSWQADNLFKIVGKLGGFITRASKFANLTLLGGTAFKKDCVKKSISIPNSILLHFLHLMFETVIHECFGNRPESPRLF
jgi:hypothetical protein